MGSSLRAFSVDCAKLGEGRVRQREFGRREILVQVGDRRGASDQKNVGSSQANATCIGVASSRVATSERVEGDGP